MQRKLHEPSRERSHERREHDRVTASPRDEHRRAEDEQEEQTLSLGLFRRDPAGLAVQVSSLTDPTRPSLGAIQLQVGVFFDLL